MEAAPDREVLPAVCQHDDNTAVQQVSILKRSTFLCVLP